MYFRSFKCKLNQFLDNSGVLYENPDKKQEKALGGHLSQVKKEKSIRIRN